MSNRERLGGIPFEETKASEPPRPPFSDLWAKEPDSRRSAWLYWLIHPRDGLPGLFLYHLFKLLPCDLVSRIGAVLAIPSMKRYRNRIFAKRIANNIASLRRLSGEDETGFEAAHRSWWQNTGRTWAEYAVVNRFWSEGRIDIDGWENLERARQNSGPLIFTSVHLGAWEALAAVLHQGIAGPCTGPFQPEPNRFLNMALHWLRKDRNQYLFPPGTRSAFRIRRLLAAGDAASMIIFVDEVRNDQVHLPLFGRQMPTQGNASAAIKLANRTNGTLVPVYLIRTEGARFRLSILPPLEKPTESGTYPLAETIFRINEIFEPLVLKHLLQWYMIGELRLPEPNFNP